MAVNDATGGAAAANVALLQQEGPVDEASVFFLNDTGVRLDRAVEISLAYGAFALLLYCRFLCPGGVEYWRWLEPSVLWGVVFLPLFLLDLRSVQHTKYLRRHRAYFAPHESVRHLVICVAELLYKILLCLHLMFKDARAFLSLKLVMIPYAGGYVVHFILGHIAPLEDGDRAEGCNVIAALLSELARFLQFVLIIVLSLKIDSSSSSLYNWQAAFWPCWGLEGIVIMVVVLLLPLCMISALIDRPQMLMLTWVVVTGAGLSIVSFISMYNIAELLDKHLCPDPVDLADEISSEQFLKCRQHLEQALWPWLAYLPAFAVGTLLIKSRLSRALHAAWYQQSAGALLDETGGSRVGRRAGAQRGRGAPDEQVLPAPRVMFRVAPTFYSRAWSAAAAAAAAQDTPSVVGSPGAAVGASTTAPAVFSSRDALMQSLTQSSVGNASVAHAVGAGNNNFVTLGSGVVVDHSTSLLSARGATFVEIVEAEQLCFVCYDNVPDAILMECGHAGLCSGCAVNIFDNMRRPVAGRQRASCPICRATVSRVLQIRTSSHLPSELFAVSSPRQVALAEDGGPVAADEDCCGSAVGVEAAAAATAGQMHSIPSGDALLEPPWPHSARRAAVVVEELRALPGLTPASRWPLGSILR